MIREWNGREERRGEKLDCGRKSGDGSTPIGYAQTDWIKVTAIVRGLLRLARSVDWLYFHTNLLPCIFYEVSAKIFHKQLGFFKFVKSNYTSAHLKVSPDDHHHRSKCQGWGLGRYDEGGGESECERALIFAHGFILSYVNGPV